MPRPSIIGHQLENTLVPSAADDIVAHRNKEDAIMWVINGLDDEFNSWQDERLEREIVKHSHYLVEENKLDRVG